MEAINIRKYRPMSWLTVLFMIDIVIAFWFCKDVFMPRMAAETPLVRTEWRAVLCLLMMFAMLNGCLLAPTYWRRHIRGYVLYCWHKLPPAVVACEYEVGPRGQMFPQEKRPQHPTAMLALALGGWFHRSEVHLVRKDGLLDGRPYGGWWRIVAVDWLANKVSIGDNFGNRRADRSVISLFIPYACRMLHRWATDPRYRAFPCWETNVIGWQDELASSRQRGDALKQRIGLYQLDKERTGGLLVRALDVLIEAIRQVDATKRFVHSYEGAEIRQWMESAGKRLAVKIQDAVMNWETQRHAAEPELGLPACSWHLSNQLLVAAVVLGASPREASSAAPSPDGADAASTSVAASPATTPQEAPHDGQPPRA